MTDVLALKYRPHKWEYVVGQKAVVHSLRTALDNGSNRTFLLSGPSGTGKTTLARLAALELGGEAYEPEEINAANYTSIDDMRLIIETFTYKPLYTQKCRVIILDEVHRLSAPAFASLLKPLEEPPENVYWFLCTTELSKVPNNIQTRCTKYVLHEVPKTELRDLLADIAAEEKITLGAGEDDHEAILDLCAAQAQGSPRAALVNLGACIGIADKAAAKKLLTALEEESVAVDLAKALMGTPDWGNIREILNGLVDQNPESIRHVVRGYITKVVLGSKKPPEKLFAVLEAFSTPFYQSDGMTPLLLACGKLFF